MFSDVFAQLRFATSIALGGDFDVRSLERLVDALGATRREFGAVGAGGAELLVGPELDDETRREIQLRRFRTQATRAARETTYYGALFDRLGITPGRMLAEDIVRIPLTKKKVLRADPDAFVRRSARPAHRCTTTGTTGRPTSILFSADELRSFVALAAMSLLMSGTVGDEDVVQMSTSTRASLGNACFAGACARIGALVHPAGLVSPAHTLALLAEERRIRGKKPRVSVLMTYPSHLGELVERGPALGYGPADFGLERIVVGGELVTDGLKAHARRLFGEVQFDEGYGMTEIWPLGGTRCTGGHLHFEPAQGMVEVIDPETVGPAGPGQVGTIVATPFPPYRQTTLLLRYDTEDVVRPLADAPSCELRHLPATGHLLGKLRLAARHEHGWTFPRHVLEALEAVDDVPLPARCGFWAAPGGVAVEVLARTDSGESRRRIERGLEEHGVPVRALNLVRHSRQLRRPLPLRCDLREVTFHDAWESVDPVAGPALDSWLGARSDGARPAVGAATWS
jgi:phenylacetate-CoA ligase